LVNEPLEFSLGQKSIDKVDSAEIPDSGLAQVQSIQHPIVLGVAITVFVGSKSVCNTLDAVYDWASEIIGRIHLVLVTSVVVRCDVDTVDDRIAHGLVGIVYADLGSQAACHSLNQSY
jgi:hypothetical protein